MSRIPLSGDIRGYQPCGDKGAIPPQAGVSVSGHTLTLQAKPGSGALAPGGSGACWPAALSSSPSGSQGLAAEESAGHQLGPWLRPHYGLKSVPARFLSGDPNPWDLRRCPYLEIGSLQVSEVGGVGWTSSQVTVSLCKGERGHRA